MSLKNDVSIGNMAEQLSVKFVKFVQLALKDYSVLSLFWTTQYTTNSSIDLTT